MTLHQLDNPSLEPNLAYLAYLQSEAAQDATDAELHVDQLRLQQFARRQQRPHVPRAMDLACIG